MDDEQRRSAKKQMMVLMQEGYRWQEAAGRGIPLVAILIGDFALPGREDRFEIAERNPRRDPVRRHRRDIGLRLQ